MSKSGFIPLESIGRSPHQPGTDFSLLQAADSALAIVAVVCASLLAGAIGYTLVFLLSTFLLLIAGATVLAIDKPRAPSPSVSLFSKHAGHSGGHADIKSEGT